MINETIKIEVILNVFLFHINVLLYNCFNKLLTLKSSILDLKCVSIKDVFYPQLNKCASTLKIPIISRSYARKLFYQQIAIQIVLICFTIFSLSIPQGANKTKWTHLDALNSRKKDSFTTLCRKFVCMCCMCFWNIIHVMSVATVMIIFGVCLILRMSNSFVDELNLKKNRQWKTYFKNCNKMIKTIFNI